MNKIAKNTNNEVAKKATQQKDKMKTSTIRVQVNMVNPKVNLETAKTAKNIKTKKPKVNKKNNEKIKLKQKNKQKELPKPQKSHKLLKAIAIIILIVSAVIFLCTTPLFNVTEILVTGNEIVSAEEIKSLSQIKLNDNTFKNIKRKIKENIKGNAYIEDVTVKRILPNKIQISVQERTIKFLVKILNKYAYVNSQGYVLEITEQTKEVPIIEGISTLEEEIIVGKRLNNEDLKKIEACLKIVSACEENEISRFITTINVENSSEYIVTMLEKEKTIHLGTISNLDTKILYVKAILQAEEGNEGDIFVNGDLNSGFQPYFRKKL